MFWNFELFSLLVLKKLWVIRTGSHRMLVRIVNREDPDQTASSEAVWSGSTLFSMAFGWQLMFKILERYRICHWCNFQLPNIKGLTPDCCRRENWFLKIKFILYFGDKKTWTADRLYESLSSGCAQNSLLGYLYLLEFWIQGLLEYIYLVCSAANTDEPWHEISNNVVCATSKGSDLLVHIHSLIRAFASRLNIQWILSYWPNSIWSF